MSSTDEILANVLKECGRVKERRSVPRAAGAPHMYQINKYRLTMVRDGVQMTEEKLINRPEVAVMAIRNFLPDDGVEHLCVLNVDAQNRMIGLNPAGDGTIRTVIVDPGRVFAPVLLGNAPAFILAHNHPSGDPTPSPDDRSAMREISELAHRMKRPMLDFIIVGDGTNRFYSAKKEGAYDLK